MVPRCAYYLNEDNDIVRHVVLIDWDLGFDKEAKHQYIMRMIDAIDKPNMLIMDITSASYIRETRMLSPIFVKMKNDAEKSVEDYIAESQIFNAVNISEASKIQLVGYIYLTNLSELNITTIKKYDGFFDVFNHPIRHPHNSQALFAILYKKLMLEHKLDVLSDYDKYVEWYNSVNIIDVTE